MINVNKPFLPPREEYFELVEGIWKRGWLTNNGPLVNELENKLKHYLNIPYLCYLNNGTIAIQIAIKALKLEGEIITTPFSYVATTSSIVWESCIPVFVDISPFNFNIDVTKIEKAITPKTTAILATHVFGSPCNIEEIESIAKKYGIKIIYDGAHAFGVQYRNKSLLGFGDITTTSFHATKLFHTIEGGAVFTQNPEIYTTMTLMRNFGHNGPETFDGVGINGKNSEFHAAMGLVNFKYLNSIIQKRKELSEQYDKHLRKLNLLFQQHIEHTQINYAYYPVVFENEEVLLKLLKILNSSYVYPRRYFYPSLNKLNYVDNTEMTVSEDISKRILCLPLYYDLSLKEVDYICNIIKQNI
jgi:dTDP-4-amino-4,6-dideoxygalactose transaminase